MDILLAYVCGIFLSGSATTIDTFVKTINSSKLLISEGRRPLGRPRRRWEDNIKMDLREIGFGDVDWINLSQDRDRWRALVNSVMNLRVP
jgi:hypothetical protein